MTTLEELDIRTQQMLTALYQLRKDSYDLIQEIKKTRGKNNDASKNT